MKISIRHAKIKDLDAMIELAKCASREGEYKGFEELSYEKQKDLISFVMDNSYVFVVELSGEVREPGKEPYFLKDEIIGTTSLKEFDAELKEEDLKLFSDEGECLLACSLLIKPFFRNSGFARRITEFAEEFAKNNGVSFLRTIIAIHNKAATKLAKETDYSLVKGNVDYIGDKFNLWEKKIN